MKISICMITYNHAPFIAQAIESVLMQETEHEVELVIGEDNSTDGTRAICESYVERYPDKIMLRPQLPHNVGGMQNYLSVLSLCNGDFLCLLEGDDYWTHPRKLHMQGDFLLNNPDFVACYTDYEVIHSGAEESDIGFRKDDVKDDPLTLETLLEGNRIATCTIMYRHIYRGQSLDWLADLPMGDWPTHILHAKHGNLKYLREVTGAYRLHMANYYAGVAPERKVRAEIQVLRAMRNHLPATVQTTLTNNMRWRYYRLVESNLRAGRLGSAVRDAVQFLRLKPLRSWQSTLLGRFRKS